MSKSDELNAKMLQLIHDLLPAAEAQQLQQQIAEDADAAEAYEEAQRQAALFAKAARLEEERIELKPPSGREVATERGAHGSKGETFVRWALALAAVLLVAVTAGGYLYQQLAGRDVAEDHLRLLVAAPAELAAGIDNQITITTQAVNGRALPAKLELALYDQRQQQLLDDRERFVKTSASGVAQFPIPADIDLMAGARFEVLAYHNGKYQRATAPLAVTPERNLTQVTFDKPWYKPGDSVRYRSLTLSSHSLAAQHEVPIQFEILDPGGAAVAGSQHQGVTDRGVGNGEFALSEGLPGGQYTLVVRSLDGAFAEYRKPFLVRAYRLPRLKKELEFARDSYVPGDTVIADVAVTKAEGGAAAGASLSVIATVDGQTVYSATEQLDAAGAFQVSFALPKEIEIGAGQLAVIVDDGGNRETIAKTLPINLGRVEVELFPEGGDLVADVSNRVYFLVRDPKGDPVHVEGRVLDGEGKKVSEFETVHEGRGVFRFAPTATDAYQFVIDKPAGVKQPVALPAVGDRAHVVLTTIDADSGVTGGGVADGGTSGGGVYDAGSPVALAIHATEPDLPLVIAAYCRGVQVGQATYSTPGSVVPGSAVSSKPISIPLADSAEGVIRLTVYDYSGRQPEPVAERLVYRRPGRMLQVEVVDQSERYSPGDTVELALKVTDEQGRPAGGSSLGIAVVDDALLGLARETQRHQPASMPTHFRLAAEIQRPEDLEDVDFYVEETAEAAVALDLLLGTQGWRRFARQSLDALLVDSRPETEAQRTQLDSLLVSYGVDRPPHVYDNLPEVRRAFEIEYAEYQQRRAAWLSSLGVAVLAGGIFLVLVVAVSAMLRWTSSPRAMVPALVAGTICLLIGMVWMSSESDDNVQAVALAPYPSSVAVVDASEIVEGGGQDDNTDGRAHWKFDGGDEAPDDEAPDDDEERREVELDENAPIDPNGAPDLPAEALGEEGEEEWEAPGDDAIAAGPAIDEAPVGEIVADPAPLGDMDRLVEANKLLRKLEDAEGADFDRDEPFAADRKDIGWDIGELRALRERQIVAGKEGKLQRREQLKNAMDRIVQQHRFVVRQYAHTHTQGEPGVRRDFTETIYWNPLLIADEDGQATVRFDLSDAVTTFRVSADVHGGGVQDQPARIGTGGGEVVARLPFNLQPKLPLEVNAGDLIDLPIAVVNDTDDRLAVDVALQYSPLYELDGPDVRVSTIDPGQRQRDFFQLAVIGDTGDAEVTFRGQAGPHSDVVSRTIRVVPPGFPAVQSYAGKLDGEQTVVVEMPDNWVPGSLNVTLQAFPSTLADLQKGLDGILREPYGCFEQTSTSNYPNVLALQYMQEHRVADPAFTRRAKDLLKKGYARLTGYECKQKGYEWFGGDPGHEALTAYGLMEFQDMAAVYDVDADMVQRTADWLLKRRDGKGGFQRNARALDSFGAAPEDVTNAYIVWALSEAGQAGIETELQHVVQLGQTSKDPYVVAMSAASALCGSDRAAGRQLLKRLKGMQFDDGHLEGAQGSITRSGGHSLKVETTAIAALAWLKDPAFTMEATRAVDWLVASRQGGGGFGSTQATIMALKALVVHAKANRATVSGGELVVLSGEAEIGRTEFAAGARDAITVEDLAEKLQPGRNVLTLQLSGDNKMPYSMEVAYRTRKPVSDEQCAVRLNVDLATDSVASGETVAMNATLTNMTDQGQPMTLAVLGIPAGLTVRPDQLDELKRSGAIDYFETTAREVICYWRSLAPNKKIDLRLDLIADIPGRYTAPASRAYLYYTAEQKWWVDPVAIRIER